MVASKNRKRGKYRHGSSRHRNKKNVTVAASTVTGNTREYLCRLAQRLFLAGLTRAEIKKKTGLSASSVRRWTHPEINLYRTAKRLARSDQGTTRSLSDARQRQVIRHLMGDTKNSKNPRELAKDWFDDEAALAVKERRSAEPTPSV